MLDRSDNMPTDVISEDAFKAIFAAKKSGKLIVAPRSFTKQPDTQGNPPKEIARIDAPKKMTSSQRRWEIDKLLEEHNIHPIEEMILLLKANGGEVPLTNDQRIKLLDILAGYTTPKVKSIEVSGGIDHTITVNIMKFEDVVSAAKPITEVAGEVVNA